MQKKKVGIFGGSFNPIHTGHIALAKSLCQQVGGFFLEWVHGRNHQPHFIQPCLLADKLRLEMAEQAVADEPKLKACDYEFHMPKPSYTWHTLQALSQDFPNVDFTLLIGGDNWASFDKWFHHEDILSHYPIVVYPRKGCDIGKVPSGVTIVETPLLNISSTEIRQRIKEGKSIHGMVPDSIEPLAMQYYSNQHP